MQQSFQNDYKSWAGLELERLAKPTNPTRKILEHAKGSPRALSPVSALSPSFFFKRHDRQQSDSRTRGGLEAFPEGHTNDSDSDSETESDQGFVQVGGAAPNPFNSFDTEAESALTSAGSALQALAGTGTRKTYHKKPVSPIGFRRMRYRNRPPSDERKSLAKMVETYKTRSRRDLLSGNNSSGDSNSLSNTPKTGALPQWGFGKSAPPRLGRNAPSKSSLGRPISPRKRIRRTNSKRDLSHFNQKLLSASKWGRLKEVQVLIDMHGADPNCLDTDHQTPLQLAIPFGNQRIIRYLLEKRADPAHCDRGNKSVLVCASEWNQKGIVEMLLREMQRTQLDSPFEDDGPQRVALISAATHNSVETIRALLSWKCPRDLRDPKTGRTALMTAAAYGQYEAVVELAMPRSTRVVMELKKRRAILTVVHLLRRAGKEGKRLALMIARFAGCGAELRLRDDSGLTARDLAARMGHDRIVRFLDALTPPRTALLTKSHGAKATVFDMTRMRHDWYKSREREEGATWPDTRRRRASSDPFSKISKSEDQQKIAGKGQVMKVGFALRKSVRKHTMPPANSRSLFCRPAHEVDSFGTVDDPFADQAPWKDEKKPPPRPVSCRGTAGSGRLKAKTTTRWQDDEKKWNDAYWSTSRHKSTGTKWHPGLAMRVSEFYL